MNVFVMPDGVTADICYYFVDENDPADVVCITVDGVFEFDPIALMSTTVQELCDELCKENAGRAYRPMTTEEIGEFLQSTQESDQLELFYEASVESITVH